MHRASLEAKSRTGPRKHCGYGDLIAVPQLSMRVSIMTTTYYRTVDVSGIRLFYREAGPVDAPVRLHGF